LTETVATCVAQLEDGEQSLHKQLNSLVSKLEAAARIDQKLGEPLQMLDSASIALQEALYSLNDWLSTLDTDPHAFTELDEKLNAIMDVSRKLRIPPALLYEQAQQLQQELDQLAQMDQLDALEQQAQSLASDFDQAAKALSASRQQAAKTLTSEVSAMMQTLHMTGGRFEVSLVEQAPSHSGLDSVEFLFAGHAGASAKPLSKIASGGELARVSLALAVVSSNTHWLETLVFDEVDTGIGGATAEVVGQLLRRLGQSRQVLCVTHLAQVAAQGHHHWLVQKVAENNEVYSNTRVLDHDGRVQELARMMGGLNITETARQQAREWLNQKPI
jgi:DNA repair protein RecN (Recombination protein N)